MTRWGLQRELALMGAGFGVLLLGTGAALALDASLTYAGAKDECVRDGCPPGTQQSAVDAGRLADFATAGFVAGGAVVVGSGVLWLTAPRRPVTIVPVVHPGSASVMVRGDFW